MRKHWFRLSAVLVIAGTALTAEPIEKVTWRYYGVDAASPRGLINQLSRRGPIGLYARTKWRIRWSSRCVVRVDVTYQFPRHTMPDAMSAELRARWEKMIVALKDHEETHGLNALAAAKEIERAKCRSGYQIMRKLSEEEKAFDRKTRHGATTGVSLNP